MIIHLNWLQTNVANQAVFSRGKMVVISLHAKRNPLQPIC